MLAVVVERYGPPEVARLREVRDPAPNKGQLLVRVLVAAVSSGDARIRAARFPPGFSLPARLAFGITKPRRPVLGGAFCGEVLGGPAAVGELAPGALVGGMTGMRLGAHAELLAVDADRAVPVPSGVSPLEAAGVLFGGTTARYFLSKAGVVGPGTTVLVNGASGAIGTNAVQIAATAGATVIGVCSTANAALVRGLGADQIVDYRSSPLSALGERFDVVLDTVGNLDIAAGRRLAVDGGSVLLAAAGLGDTVRARGSVVAGAAPERTEDMRWLFDRVAAGDISVVVDCVGALEDMSDLYRRVDSGRKVGNVVVEPTA